jgi:hypothetical protein
MMEIVFRGIVSHWTHHEDGRPIRTVSRCDYALDDSGFLRFINEEYAGPFATGAEAIAAFGKENAPSNAAVWRKVAEMRK